LGLNPTAVHTVVARLRRQLSAPDLVRTGREGYLLPLEVDVDAVDHEHLIRSARDLRSAGQVDEAVRRYRRALALWSGPLAYEGVTDELVLAERTRLEDAKATANEQLATLLLEGGTVPHLEEALAVANDLVGEFPLREGPTRLVMRAAYALGSQAEALRAYADLRARLREELGIDPSPPTQALHAQVLAQAESLVAPARPEHRRITTAIPVPASETIGREEDLERLRRWREAGHRLLTLVGPGGVGKSRLLHELGRQVSGELVYVDLSGLTEASAQEVAAAICIEYRLGAAGPDPVATLSAALTRAHLTVLVDEAEWSSTAVATIARVLMEHCPGVSMVITHAPRWECRANGSYPSNSLTALNRARQVPWPGPFPPFACWRHG
jgi:DNA-binding SARP family transcriptional activator